mmetsp:Transcript_14597/g.31830  ORF Transcript_14597/g.31830 Transcript_14597/m.31830 type:complete len:90 (-) Transcript_14597:662-931(-)
MYACLANDTCEPYVNRMIPISLQAPAALAPAAPRASARSMSDAAPAARAASTCSTCSKHLQHLPTFLLGQRLGQPVCGSSHRLSLFVVP